MNTHRTLVAITLLALAGPVSPGVEAPTRDAVRISVAVPGATVTAETSDQVDEVVWALVQYHRSGLELPHVSITMRSPGRCPTSDGGQNAGSLRISSAGEYRIVVCGTRRTLLHELAHVWDRHNLDEATREEFLELRGLESWNHDVWDQAGGEHLAETLSWALDEQTLLPSRIPDNTAEELAQAYRLLTGAEAPILERMPPLRPHAPPPVGEGEILETTDLAPGQKLG